MKLYASITGIALVVSLVVGFTLFNKGTTTVVHQDGTTTTVGAAASPDRYSPYESRNGILQVFSGHIKLGVGTTTVCTIKNPVIKSTLLSLEIGMTVSSTTAANVVIATSTQITATTTSMISYNTIANGTSYFSFIPTTTANQLQTESQFINVSMSGGTGTFSPTGFCQATYEVY